MMSFHEERDTPEIRLMRTVIELNHRILHTVSPDERTALRASITVIRGELIKLIESMPIFSEEDAKRASTAQGLVMGSPPLGRAS